MSYSEILDKDVLNKAIKLAKGVYQVNILLGVEAISGATLRGKARNYAYKYKRSSRNLIKRCQKAGLPIDVEIKEHNKRVLVIGR